MCVRSLISHAGWSKKTQRPGGRFVTGCGMAAQIAMGDQGIVTLAMRAGTGAYLDTEIEQFPRARREKSGELHAGRLARRATPYFGALSQVAGLNKTEPPAFHGTVRGGKTAVQTQSQQANPPRGTKMAGITPCFGQDDPVSIRQKSTRFFDQWMEIHT